MPRAEARWRGVHARSSAASGFPDGEEIGRLDPKLEGETDADRQHEQAEQQPQMFAAYLLPRASAELCAGDAADHQVQRKYGVAQIVGHRKRQVSEILRHTTQ